MQPTFRLGLIINPLAGLGGSVALKGSDNVAEEALRLGAIPKATDRMRQALDVIMPYAEKLQIITAAGSMGQTLVEEMGFPVSCCYQPAENTTAEDTCKVASIILAQKPDLLLFAGGDGTARDIFRVVDDGFPVLGVPAGVKIHSGVYGITPHASGMVLKMLLDGQLVSLMQADVMDIDEVAFRAGTVRAKRYGEMTVPAAPRYIQSVKMGGREVDELVLADIAAEVIEHMEDERYIMGSGSTVAAIMEELGLDNTLLGVDLVQDRQLIGRDLNASELLAATDGFPVKLVITLIGGQGHILGRGNQQLSPELIRRIGKDNIIIVATKTKLKALAGKPLIVDSGDPALDAELSGYFRIITGYRDYVMYQVANPDLAE
ncbi:ATP-NAD kinase family protein [Shewanella yunxiaonensis]|uniref:ATP-NAD kinase family protein n=1 Tax=Shewanella yunxiaonensis TaxID=2829809 RepID=A0ABX7YYR1_9GAMM|nr:MULTISPECIES: ATP-NAD kinase family protein [Shewanella]MDF0535430.1 ATP-NAD kinase family protein [Shewanella sp. A32]QUN07196.1 ATP-NAD kinase family protein [Shewanella yunxiaonensis]